MNRGHTKYKTRKKTPQICSGEQNNKLLKDVFVEVSRSYRM